MPAILAPLAWIYGAIAGARLQRPAGYRSSLPVLCVGNLTAGGTGKTPMAIYLAQLLAERGERPVFLSRGYGGSITGPHWVNYSCDQAADVGDEPLLLAKHAPTMIARDRARGARAIERSGHASSGDGNAPPSVIIMDDGLQNRTLAKDLTLALISATRGLGNGKVIPAGPLRAPLAAQLALVDAIVVTGQDWGGGRKESIAGPERMIAPLFDGPVFAAQTRPHGDTGWLKDLDVLAFTGIAAPDRFFDLLRRLGARVVRACRFSDHHSFSDQEAAALIDMAQARCLQLVTTQKDMMRLRICDPAVRPEAVNRSSPASTASPVSRLFDLSRELAIKTDFDAPDKAQIEKLLELMLRHKSGSTC